VTAFFESLYKAMGTQAENAMTLLLMDLAHRPQHLSDNENYANAVALGVVMGNAAATGWEIQYVSDPFLGQYSRMFGTLGAETYEIFVYADASFDVNDLKEIPVAIMALIDEIDFWQRDRTERGIEKSAIIIPIFEATQSEIDQLEAEMSEIYDLPPDVLIILVWVDEYTGIVHGKCINCPAGKEDQVLNDAALAQFGVGIGEQWPHWVDPEGFLPEVAAFFGSPEDAGYQILGTPVCLSAKR